MLKIGFSPADILIPQSVTMENWSVVACDQYTSEPEYWQRVAERVNGCPSAYHMILPEAWLQDPAVEDRIGRINGAMEQYLAEGIFAEYPDTYIYVERTVAPGKIRRGLIGKIDLMEYDYSKGSQSLVRPTEGTVESRLPPRIRVRENAPLELPHIMVLLDDSARTVIEPLAVRISGMQKLYDFNLMEQGGHISGYAVDAQSRAGIDAALGALAGAQAAQSASPLLFAVGDGNHSLATAKACFEKLRAELPKEQWENHPARYALVELVNVHDPAMEFEPIHRIVCGVDPDALLAEIRRYYRVSDAADSGQSLTYVTRERTGRLFIENPSSALAVGTLQNFLDDYLAKHGGTVDYIHGDDVLKSLAQSPDAIGFLLPAMQKSELFPTVVADGALPRKTFSMGHAYEKRYYLECRRIK
ncbi:DUF1015 domain-containing protein [Anaerotruncus sp. AF02-27]|uniref:DUF1015 domain-containing protein n=1 Tax=Anaerotruncus TaxID=244127 RepID=UPI000E51182F|nr:MULTISPECIES: DUF1015 domain-containing protein [Anaerotruncus]RGX54345.1 DUF1015 domain-containing protein [Anaerotruncus sp. AF02-27]